MTDKDLVEIKRLLALRTADMGDKDSCLRLIRTYINEGAAYCLTCDPAVRNMFKTLRDWAEGNGIIKTNV